MTNRVAHPPRTPRVSAGLCGSLLVLGSTLSLAAAGCSNPPPYEDPGDPGGSTDTPDNVVGDGSSGNDGDEDRDGSGGDGSGDGNGDGSGGDGASGDGTAVECPPGLLGHPDCAFEYPTYDGFTLTVAEEFDSPIDLDADPIWTWSDGGLDEGNVRFVKEQIQFEDGVMKLVADSGSVPSSQSFAEVKVVSEKPLRSGEFRAKYNNFRYGRYEVRMKAPELNGNPDVNGNFIATLFAFRTPKCEQWREIDLEVTGSAPGSVGSNLIYANDVVRYDQTQNDFQPTTRDFNARADFHVYAFEWLPNKVTYFIDGQEIRNSSTSPVPVPSESAKVMMNLWIFNSSCDFGGPCTAVDYPIWSEYDWFRFYKWDGEDTYPCSPTPACLSDGDLDGSKNNPTDGVPNVAGTCSG